MKNVIIKFQVTQLQALTKKLTKNFDLKAKIYNKKQFRKTLAIYKDI